METQLARGPAVPRPALLHAVAPPYRKHLLLASDGLLGSPCYRIVAELRARATSEAVTAVGLEHHVIPHVSTPSTPLSISSTPPTWDRHSSDVDAPPAFKMGRGLRPSLRVEQAGSRPAPRIRQCNPHHRLPSHPDNPGNSVHRTQPSDRHMQSRPLQQTARHQPQPQSPSRRQPSQSKPAKHPHPQPPAPAASNDPALGPPSRAAQRSRTPQPGGQAQSPQQLTASLHCSTSLQQLLSQLASCGPLNAVQLCAAFTAAEHIAAREGAAESAASTAAADGNGPGPGRRSVGGSSGLLAPPCRTLTQAESAALTAVLAAHSEVLADAHPPELAATLWAAARLRLRLPPLVLEPALEAVWMWDPADPNANCQPEELLLHQTTSQAVGGRVVRRGPMRRAVMGPAEVCLLLYAASVLWPEYVRQNAGGFLEALDSYETTAGGAAAAPRRRRGGGSSGGLSCEQVVGVVTALARSDATLDEVEEEFVLQAVSSRLTAFSLPQLTALLTAAQGWGPLRRSLHGSLLAALLASLEHHHARFMQERKAGRERARAEQAAEDQRRREPLEAAVEREAERPSMDTNGSSTAAAAAAADADSAAVARALVAALRSGVDPVSGRSLPSRVLSGLMRQLRLRAPTFSSRDVCEGLRTLAALAAAPTVQPQRIIRWKEGLRGLLRRWAKLLPEDVAAAVTAGSGAEAAAAARTYATSFHAVCRLGLRLQAAESAAAASAAAGLAPYMGHLADCVMTLTALTECLADIEGEDGKEQGQQGQSAAALQSGTQWPAPMTVEATAEDPAAGTATEDVEAAGDSWVWLQGSGVRCVGPLGREAVQLVLERAAVLLQQQADSGGRQPAAAAVAGPGELVCMIRVAASAGAWPPRSWWRRWREAVAAALPPHLRPPLQGPPKANSAAVGQLPHPAMCLSCTEAVDVLYSLARLTHLRQYNVSFDPETPQEGLQGGPRRWKWLRRRRPSGVCGSAAASIGGDGSAVPPLERELLTALLKVACLGPTQPPRRRRDGGGAAAGGGAPRLPCEAPPEVGTLSVYFMSWAVARLELVTPQEAALWGPRLAAAAPRALARLTPRKQVLLLRSLTRALRGAAGAAAARPAAQLPPPLPAAWLSAFAASMTRARGQTLSYAAAAMAAARIRPPARWQARFQDAVRARVPELGVREIAALVAGLQLHRRQPQQPQEQLLQLEAQGQQQQGHQGHQEQPLWRRPLVEDQWGSAGLARALLQALRRRLAPAAVQQPLNGAERQLARRLCFLLARGAAAGGAGSPTAGAQRLLRPLPAPTPAAAGAEEAAESARWTLTREVNGSSSSSEAAGLIDSGSSSSRNGGGLLLLAPRPRVVLPRGNRDRRTFRLPTL